MKNVSSTSQRGAVSLFVVIFSMLIITVITVSFLRLMMADQQQASDNDLSQSAYDSAQAGVEDAKRALLRYQQICNTTPEDCGALSDDLSSAPCNEALTTISGLVSPKTTSPDNTGVGEVPVQQSTTVDGALDQAYTCVTMQLQTDDYIGSLAPGESQLIPLYSRETFNTVTVRWFSKENLSNTSGAVQLDGAASSRPLPVQSSWNTNTPPVMRTQLVQFGDEFTMSSFDTVSGSESNANTVFLFPTQAGGAATNGSFTGLDNRKSNPTDDPDADVANQTPQAVRCETNLNNPGAPEYSCSMSLTLPAPIGGDIAARKAFLRLTPFYNSTNFQVVLSRGDPSIISNLAKFQDVQPIIDSTGRANDIFRRVQSRVDLYNTNFPYPDATIDITGSFCKNFSVGVDPATYRNSLADSGCTP